MEPRTSRREDMITIVLSLWVVSGLFVDAYKHVTDPQLESFWTPWHALFYSGFVVTAGWLVLLRFRHHANESHDLFAAPQGYRSAMYGIGLFALGGIGDAIWHEVFGVETSLDALLSPTHLMLYVGLSLIISSPFRARWHDRSDIGGGTAPSFAEFFPALASLSLATTLTAFFFEYAWAPVQIWTATIPYNPATNSEEWAAFGFLTILVSTVITFAPVLVASRRWRLPFGAVTTHVATINVLIAVGFDKDFAALPAVLIAGIVMDSLIARRAPRSAIVAVPPFVMWALYFPLVARVEDLGWPAEIWGGSIVFAVLAVLAIDRLMSLAVAAASTQAEVSSGDRT